MYGTNSLDRKHNILFWSWILENNKVMERKTNLLQKMLGS
jgi:hypothetical protein